MDNSGNKSSSIDEPDNNVIHLTIAKSNVEELSKTKRLSRTFTFDVPPFDSSLEFNDQSLNNETQKKKTELHIDLINTSTQPNVVIQSPKTPTLSRKLKAISLDSSKQEDETSSKTDTASCLELPRNVISMPCTPKKQIRTLLNKSLDNSANTSVTNSLKTLPESEIVSDTGNKIKLEPAPSFKLKAKGLLERRGSNVSLTIDLCAATSEKRNTTSQTSGFNFRNYRTQARSVSNLNLETNCDCSNDKKNIRKIKKFQKLSQESCLCDNLATDKSANLKIAKTCQYSRLGCLNYLSYMRRKSLSNENLYLGPSLGGYSSATNHKNQRSKHREEFPRQMKFDTQNLSDDFQMHLQNIQYLQTAGKALTIEQLRDCCKIENLKVLHKEFWELPQNFQEKSCVSGIQSKNRYKTILPNEHSRVILENNAQNGLNLSEGYINANYIKGYDYSETAYIATQGPLPHTCSDIWKMVMQVRAHKVVMLTPLMEKGRIKCEIYFPKEENEQMIFDNYEIKCLNLIKEKYYQIRVLRVRDLKQYKKMKCANFQNICDVINSNKCDNFSKLNVEKDMKIEKSIDIDAEKVIKLNEKDHLLIDNKCESDSDKLKKLNKKSNKLKKSTTQLCYGCEKIKKCCVECRPSKNNKLTITVPISPKAKKLNKKSTIDDVMNEINYFELNSRNNSRSNSENNSPNIQKSSNNNNNQFFNDDINLNDLDDDIFLVNNDNFKSPRLFDATDNVIQKRDFKFSDDFSDIVMNLNDISKKNDDNKCLEINSCDINSQNDNNVLNEHKIELSDRPNDDVNDETNSQKETLSQNSLLNNIITEADHLVQHYWYDTWPDHNLANTEEILALALDVLELKTNVPFLFNYHKNILSYLNVPYDDSSHLINQRNNYLAATGASTTNQTPSVHKMPITQNKSLKEDKFNISTSQSLDLSNIENLDQMIFSSHRSCESKQSQSVMGNKSYVVESTTNNVNNNLVKTESDDRELKSTSSNEKLTRKRNSLLNVPLVVHCSAGIGRTGCFLAILNGIQQLRVNKMVDILAIVCALRLNRGGMVQTAEQYELIHKVLALYSQYFEPGSKTT